MKTRILVGMYLLVALVACQKESDVINPVIEDPTYFPLTTGSYWVYNTYKIDSLKNEELISENDTTTIIGDTNLNGYQYKVFYGKEYGFSGSKTEKYLRDSLGYIVNSDGNIVFSQTNFIDTLYSETILTQTDTAFIFFTKMFTYSNHISLSVGDFDSLLNCQMKVVFCQDPNRYVSILDNLYAPNIGKLIDQYGYTSQLLEQKTFYEERLINYYIAE